MAGIRHRSVAVVGGAGFLGSHLVNHLIEDRNCKVVVIDNLVVGRREFIHPDAAFEHHDITTSEEHLVQIFDSHGVEYVFNYAAYPYIPDSFARPLHVFNVNAFGALKVINAAHACGCTGILQVSSAEIYGGLTIPNGTPVYPAKEVRQDEETNVAPHSSYGASKAAIDFLIQARWYEAKVPVITLRQFNCIGERETHPYVVPEIISQLTHGSEWKVRLGNNSYRDFLYAGDAVRMAVELLEKGQYGEVYNLGSESGIKIYNLARLIGEVMAPKAGAVEVINDKARERPWEIWHLQSDNDKAYKAISTRPTVTLEDAIARTIAYYNENGQRWVWE